MLLEGVWKKFGIKNNFSSTPPSNLNYDWSLTELLDGLPHHPENKFKESSIIADPSAKFETTSKRAGGC